MSETDDQLLQRISDVETLCNNILGELRNFEQAMQNVRVRDMARIDGIVNSMAAEVNNLAGQVSNLSGEVNNLAGQVSNLPRIVFELQSLDERLRRLGG